MAKAAADYGATVLLSNHSEFDDAYFKAHTAAGRKPGEPNPFEVGTDGVARYFACGPGLHDRGKDSSRWPIEETRNPRPLRRVSRYFPFGNV